MFIKIKNNLLKYIHDGSNLAKWLLPGLIAVTVISNQPWAIAPVPIGQMIGWLINLLAVFFVFSVVGRNLRFIAFILGLIAAKVFTILYPSDAILNTMYYFLAGCMFSFIGALVCFRYPRLIYKQIMIICLINVFFMLLQIIGVGAWTQFLTTHGVGIEDSKIPMATLFVKNISSAVSVMQRRPAGLLYANQFLSLILLFGIAVNFSYSGNRFKWGTLIICIMMVLAMAKIAFLGFVIIFLLLLILGTPGQKSEIFKTLIYIPFVLFLYYIFFPGLFVKNLSLQAVKWSFFIRLNDMVNTLPETNIAKESLLESLFSTPKPEVSLNAHVSGYSEIMPILPYLVIIMLMLLPFYCESLYKIRQRFPYFVWTSIFTLVAITIFPYICTIWKSQLYWFFAGFGLLPLFFLFKPKYFQQVQKAAVN
jgi:hypothetical protein